jgi:hypothetical protein
LIAVKFYFYAAHVAADANNCLAAGEKAGMGLIHHGDLHL